MDEQQQKVQVGKHEFVLVLPTSMCARFEVSAAGTSRSKHRAYAAALALSVRQLAAWVATPSETWAGATYEYDPQTYGGHVIDYLSANGVPLKQIVAAGKVAWLAVTASLPSDAEVKAAEDFSAAPAAPASS